MIWDGKMERRGHRRAAIRIVSEFGDPGSATRIETVDFSASGVSFWLNRPMQTMTKLALRFEFPEYGNGEARAVSAEAIVVRCQKDAAPEGRWIVAAAFTGLSPADREFISSYVDWHHRMGIEGSSDRLAPGTG
ncbi:MAG: PilZ domain-containing protein [Candidatus Eisenbacteria bacterium]|nr:PilZ domain-containing protein [Candidatus Eisenbacteria bacterium]